MRIVGDVKDYYDGVISLFQEESYPLWVRKTRLETEESPIRHYSSWSFFSDTIEPFVQDSGIIVFCGKGYPYFNVVLDGKVELVNSKECLFDLEELNTKRRKNRWHHNSSMVKAEIDVFFEEVYNYDWSELHRKYNSPVLLFKKTARSCYPYYHGRNIDVEPNLVINPILKDYGFAGIKDPYSAIQEIDMYLGNQLAQEVEAPQITDDEIKKASHGFGHKYAFKTEPGKKKKVRRLKKKQKKDK